MRSYFGRNLLGSELETDDKLKASEIISDRRKTMYAGRREMEIVFSSFYLA